MESHADVAWENMTADNDTTRGSMGGERQQAGGVHGGNLEGAIAASCFPGPELRSESPADVGLLVAEAQHLSGPMGTERLGGRSKKKRKKKGAAKGGSAGTTTANNATVESDQEQAARLKAVQDAIEACHLRGLKAGEDGMRSSMAGEGGAEVEVA